MRIGYLCFHAEMDDYFLFVIIYIFIFTISVIIIIIIVNNLPQSGFGAFDAEGGEGRGGGGSADTVASACCSRGREVSWKFIQDLKCFSLRTGVSRNSQDSAWFSREQRVSVY